MTKLLAMAALALSIMASMAVLAQKAMPGDRVYDLRSERQGNCPSLNWHVVVTAGGVLSGMIAFDDMKVMARVAGTIDPVLKVERFGKPLGGNPQDRTFQMIATEAGGKNRIANIHGTIWHNGWVTATIEGSGVACQHIKVQWLVPTSPG